MISGSLVAPLAVGGLAKARSGNSCAASPTRGAAVLERTVRTLAAVGAIALALALDAGAALRDV